MPNIIFHFKGLRIFLARNIYISRWTLEICASTPKSGLHLTTRSVAIFHIDLCMTQEKLFYRGFAVAIHFTICVIIIIQKL